MTLTPVPPMNPGSKLKKVLEQTRDVLRKDVSTTMIYTHVLNRLGIGVKSPLD